MLMESIREVAAGDRPAPADVVAAIISSRLEAKETDVALLGVLSKRILTVSPTTTAVMEALADIERLASERAENQE
jgi:hypothetical protein